MKIYDRELFVASIVYGIIGAYFTYYSILLFLVSAESSMLPMVVSITLNAVSLVTFVKSLCKP